MRIALVIGLLAAVSASARADTFQDRDTFGIDVSTVWEPSHGDAFGAGPLLRFESFTSRLPDWLGVVTRFGMVVDSADRVYAPLTAGVLVRRGDTGAYVSLEGGGTIANVTTADPMTDALRIDWTASAAVGYRYRHWDLRASAMIGGMYEGAAWMFSIGRDFVRLESTTTRTTL